MRAPPPLPPTALSPVESSLDRAFSQLLGGEAEGALRLAAAIVRHDPSNAAAFFLAGRLLGELGREADARTALGCAMDRAIDAANPPLAVAAARELGRFGGDEGPALDRVAAAFCKGAAPSGPPSVPPSGAFEPLPRALAGEALLDAASAAVRDAASADPRARAAVAPGSTQPAAPFAADASLALFASLGADALRVLSRACTVRLLPAGTRVIEQDALSHEAYLVARGEASVWRSGKDHEVVALARLGAGAIFGEIALLSVSPRTASVVASRPSIVLEIAREAVDALDAAHPSVREELARGCESRMRASLSRSSRVLQSVPSSARPALMAHFDMRTFAADALLIAQDDPTPGLYLIASGEVAVVRREATNGEAIVVTRLGPGDVVGEVAMVLRRRAIADVVAVHATVTLFLPAAQFLGLVAEHPAMLVGLYLLAVRRDEETAIIREEEAVVVEDFVLV